MKRPFWLKCIWAFFLILIGSIQVGLAEDSEHSGGEVGILAPTAIAFLSGSSPYQVNSTLYATIHASHYTTPLNLTYALRVISQPTGGGIFDVTRTGITNFDIFSFVPRAVGNYSIRLFAVDPSGQSNHVILNFAVLGTAPNLSVTLPSVPVQVGQQAKVLLHGSGPFPISHFNVTPVSLPLGNNYNSATGLNLAANSSGNGEFNFIPNVVGSYNFEVVSVDNQGQVSSPLPFSVVIGNNNAPTVTASMGSPPFFAGTQYFLNVNAVAASGRTITSITATVVNKPLGSNLTGGSVSNVSNHSFPITPDLPSPFYEILVTARDSQNVESAPVLVKFIALVRGPDLVATLGPPLYSVGVPVPILVSATPLPGSTITSIFANVASKPSGSTVSSQVVPGSSTQIDITPDLNGEYTFAVQAQDSNGRFSLTTRLTFVVGGAPPIIQTLMPTPSVVLVGGGGTVNFSADVTPGISIDPVGSVAWKIKIPGGSTGPIPNLTPPPSVSAAFSNFSAVGSYTVTLEATSSRFLKEAAITTFDAVSVNRLLATPNGVPANTPVGLSLETDGDPSSFTVEWSVTDQFGNPPCTNCVTTTSTNPIAGTWTPSCAGNFQISVTVSDAAGGSITRTVDVAAFELMNSVKLENWMGQENTTLPSFGSANYWHKAL